MRTGVLLALNLAVVQVGTDGKVRLFTSAQSHAVVDVAGYFT